MIRAEFGDIWAVGPHVYVCSDLMDQSHVFEQVVASRHLDFAYVDPPWTVPIANRFRASGEVVPLQCSIEDVFERTAKLARKWDIPLFVEAPRRPTGIFSALQSYGNLLQMEVGDGDFYSSVRELEPAKSYAAMRTQVFTPRRGQVMVDLFSGLGQIGYRAAKLGCIVISNEVSNVRMTEAIVSMSRYLNERPRHLSKVAA